jgi:hypothetical protein
MGYEIDYFQEEVSKEEKKKFIERKKKIKEELNEEKMNNIMKKFDVAEMLDDMEFEKIKYNENLLDKNEYLRYEKTKFHKKFNWEKLEEKGFNLDGKFFYNYLWNGKYKIFENYKAERTKKIPRENLRGDDLFKLEDRKIHKYFLVTGILEITGLKNSLEGEISPEGIEKCIDFLNNFSWIYDYAYNERLERNFLERIRLKGKGENKEETFTNRNILSYLGKIFKDWSGAKINSISKNERINGKQMKIKKYRLEIGEDLKLLHENYN